MLVAHLRQYRRLSLHKLIQCRTTVFHCINYLMKCQFRYGDCNYYLPGFTDQECSEEPTPGEWRFKSSRSQMFFKIGVLKNFAIFTGCVLVPFEKYGCPKNAPKQSFPCRIYEKVKWNSLRNFRNKNFFKRLGTSLEASNIKYFRTLSPYHEGASCVAKSSTQ